jgi:hypothetical protein
VDSTLSTTQLAIKDEIYRALEELGANGHLLAIVGSWGDTLTEAEVLEHLRTWNESGRVFERVLASTSRIE